ncbi:IAP-2 [Lymantria xylina nucleopolyhedrovirus]|uniref:IAP-2 n=1 Tax=Lymantria xylina multiple nucleopolyhedrovirus TaxID=2847840 RepID=D4N2B2_9ABAC|nr:IAP-2 [Lymantria xylina nucleopolyhedrovirus]ADD73784.1 IAP-2 [Lymantria xylina nucleopolyhedrovirus]
MNSTLLSADLAPPARLKSMDAINLTDDEKAKLARDGFFYATDTRRYECVYCAFSMKKVDARAVRYHAFSSCPKSLHWLQTDERRRAASFQAFKVARSKYGHGAKTLAACGFFYNARCREAQCSRCSMAVVKLQRGDDLRFIHGVYSPKCAFVNSPAAPAQPIPSAPPVDAPVDVYEDDINCKICFERPRNVCFLPCRHLCACAVCARRCSACCICRQTILNKIEIYLH